MTTPAAAPAVPAAAAPAAPAPAAPAASLIPAAAPAVVPAAAPAVVPAAAAPSWVYADGTPGTGDAPAWYRADKYKTVAAQAEAYTHLEKRLGSFVGAPKDGVYVFKAPEGVQVELDNEHPLLTGLQKWGTENQLSQDGYNHLLGMLAQYEASNQVDMNEVKKEIGADADTRIAAAAQWGKANLDAAGYESFRMALSGPQAAAVFTTFEALIGKTKQVTLPKPGADVPAGQPGQLQVILAKQGVKDEKGRVKFFVDPKYRAEVEKELADFYKAQSAA